MLFNWEPSVMTKLVTHLPMTQVCSLSCTPFEIILPITGRHSLFEPFFYPLCDIQHCYQTSA